MNSQNISPDITKLSEKLSAAEHSIQELQQKNQELQDKVDEISSERDRIAIENRLAIQDAELARSFKKTDYTPLIEELFIGPAEQLRKRTLSMITLAVVATVGLTYLLSGYLIFQNNQTMSEELARINRTIDLIHTTEPESSVTAEVTPQVIATATTTVDEPLAETEAPKQANQTITEVEDQPVETIPSTSVSTPEASSEPEIATVEQNTTQDSATTEKERLIEQQTAQIIDFVKNSERQRDFPQDYRTDRNKLAQLYLIVMQQANNTNLYYESYVNAMRGLGVSNEVLPNGVDDIMTIDKEFLHAIYSAYVITQQKQLKQWRYRDIDRRFSSYYSADSRYQLGAWQIVNESNNYEVLPKIFAINIQRIMQQAEFNNRKDSMQIPDTIHYVAYDQTSKNQSVKNLFKNKTLVNDNGILALNVGSFPLALNQTTITRVQEKLAEGGFMSNSVINGIAGPKTAAAITEYRIQNDLTVNNQIDLELLKSLDIQPTYDNLAFNP